MSGLTKYLSGVKQLLRANRMTPVAPASLTGKTIFFYFTASWCPHCSETAQYVLPYYQRHHREKDFELIVVSWDDSVADFYEYMHVDLLPRPVVGGTADKVQVLPGANGGQGEAGLLYVDIKAQSDTIAALIKTFRISGIPSMIGVDADTGKRVTVNALTMMKIDPEAERYPWW
ncbi:tryparedoxin [Strigomonas culicis]|uniref:Tryparedoxin n=1 Tax=Strigomonas culicis TaxID=28005 RepID=S9UTS1_9TRYP|nr:tryparedoxin [Strigomonas culicis]|eukprot:EPY32204.1 tryparedoxin [Strigomonas culicis]